MRSRLVAYSVLAALVAIGVWLVHVQISTPLQIERWRYPLDAFAVRWSTRCTNGAPEWLKDSLNELVSISRSPANQISYVSPDGKISECHNGWRRGILQGERVTESTPFRIASLTKFFTAFLALEAYQRGRLDLNQSITHLLPELIISKGAASPWVSVSGFDLLRHSMGMDRLKQPDPMLTADERPACPEELALLATSKFDFEPGTRYAYGNVGYCLTGVMLERISGISFRSQVTQRFGPKTEHQLTFIDGPLTPDELEYDTRFSDFWSSNYWKRFDLRAFSAAGGLKITATDFARVIHAEREPLSHYLTEASKHVLPGQDCSVFMRCYVPMGAFFNNDKQRAHVWRGSLVGSASMLIISSSGAALVWLGGGETPGQLDRDERMFRRWIAHM